MSRKRTDPFVCHLRLPVIVAPLYSATLVTAPARPRIRMLDVPAIARLLCISRQAVRKALRRDRLASPELVEGGLSRRWLAPRCCVRAYGRRERCPVHCYGQPPEPQDLAS